MNKKKKWAFVSLIFGIIFLLVGCHDANPNTDSRNNEKEKNPKIELSLEEGEYSLSVLETIKISNDLSIKLISINDSRCPKEVECYWQGELEYQILINQKNDTISTVLKRELEYQNYIIRIVEEKCETNFLTIKVENK